MSLSKYDLSNELKTSTEMGVLTPIHWQDVVPGDKIRCNSKSIIRLQPLLSPVYNSILYNVRYYYIPYRLLISNFGRFLVQADNSSLALPMLSSHVSASDVTSGFNYLRLFGINWSGKLTDEILGNISSLPFRALHLVYNYYFKNELLDDSYIDMMQPEQFGLPQFKGFQFIAPLFVTYYNDYFTDAYPTPQVGTPVNVDLDSNSQILVPEIDFATRLQRFKERLLLVGKSYRKFLQRFHGVTVNSDLLDVPRLIGSASQVLNISDVDQVAPSANEPVGSIYGKSVTVASKFGYSQEFNEHGIVLGLSYVLPSQAYVQGIPREFQKRTRFDFYTPDFASVGMQELRGNELSAERTDTFGYTPRYGELRQSKNVIAGDFVDSLSYWHFGRSLSGERLSKDFVRYVPNNSPFSVIGTEFTIKTEISFSLCKSTSGNRYYLVVFPDSRRVGSTLSFRNRFTGDEDTISVLSSEALGNRIFVFKEGKPFLLVDFDLSSDEAIFNFMMLFLRGGYRFCFSPTVYDVTNDVDMFNRGHINNIYEAFNYITSFYIAGSRRKFRYHINFDVLSILIHCFSTIFYEDNYAVLPLQNGVVAVPDRMTTWTSELNDEKLRDRANISINVSTKSVTFNHVLIANYNQVDALRPIPKLEF